MIIDIRTIPEDGLDLESEIQGDIFQLNDEGVRAEGPVSCHFHVSIVSGSLLVQGEIRCQFRLECVRCLSPVHRTVDLQDVIISKDIDDSDTIDLTDAIREDILLALPAYPHCEDGTPPRECPAQNRFKEQGASSPDSTQIGQNRDVWSGLEGFKPSKPDASNEEPGS